jgi:hypothetical protein
VPASHCHRGAALELGLCCKEIGEALRFRKIYAAIHERAAGELAGFGATQARNFRQFAFDGSHHCAPAMHVQLSHVVSGYRGWSGEPKKQSIVEGLARF